jgi:hypothetical protein
LSGWIHNKYFHKDNDLISFVSTENRLVGYGIIGMERPDLLSKIGIDSKNSGFKGYVLANMQATKIYAYNNSMNCRLPIKIPNIFFKIIDSNNLSIKPTVKSSSLIGINEWTGKDFEKSKMHGMKVIGSLVNSDSDLGTVSLRLKRGDRLYYRSGPTPGRQKIEIVGYDFDPVMLPKCLNWELLEFSSDKLPDEFVVKFIDDGDGWGEWSALAFEGNL